jgi:hypothetical protein
MSLEKALDRHSAILERFLPLLERVLDRLGGTTAPVSADEPAGELVLDMPGLLGTEKPDAAPAPLPQSAPATRASSPEAETAKTAQNTREAFRHFAEPPAPDAAPAKRGPGRPPKVAQPARPIRSRLEPDDTSAAIDAMDVGPDPAFAALGKPLPEIVEDNEETLALKKRIWPVSAPIVEAIAAWNEKTPENVTAHEIVTLHGQTLTREDARDLMTGYMGPEGSTGRPERLANIGKAIAYVGDALGTTITKFADIPDDQVRTVVDQLGVILGVYRRDPLAVYATGPDPF